MLVLNIVIQNQYVITSSAALGGFASCAGGAILIRERPPASQLYSLHTPLLPPVVARLYIYIFYTFVPRSDLAMASKRTNREFRIMFRPLDTTKLDTTTEGKEASKGEGWVCESHQSVTGH